MQTEESQKIAKRFFQALYALKELKVIRGKQTFTRKYGINRWNFNTIEKEPHRDSFQLEWLMILARDYGISAEWLLLGKGDMFEKKRGKKRVTEVKKEEEKEKK